MSNALKLFLLAAGELLAGCDQVKQLATITADVAMADEPITLVFAPGSEVTIDAKPVRIFGFDACPEQQPAMTRFFGPAPTDGSAGCVVVTPKTTSVRVRLALNAGPVIEQWAVHRDDQHQDRVYLKRPDGSSVVSYAHKEEG